MEQETFSIRKDFLITRSQLQTVHIAVYRDRGKKRKGGGGKEETPFSQLRSSFTLVLPVWPDKRTAPRQGGREGKKGKGGRERAPQFPTDSNVFFRKGKKGKGRGSRRGEEGRIAKRSCPWVLPPPGEKRGKGKGKKKLPAAPILPALLKPDHRMPERGKRKKKRRKSASAQNFPVQCALHLAFVDIKKKERSWRTAASTSIWGILSTCSPPPLLPGGERGRATEGKRRGRGERGGATAGNGLRVTSEHRRKGRCRPLFRRSECDLKGGEKRKRRRGEGEAASPWKLRPGPDGRPWKKRRGKGEGSSTSPQAQIPSASSPQWRRRKEKREGKGEKKRDVSQLEIFLKDRVQWLDKLD